MSRFQSRWIFLVIGIAVGLLAMWGFNSLQNVAAQGVTPYVVEGYSTWTNADGTAIVVSTDPKMPGEGYTIAGATWQEFGGPWHFNGFPPSLAQPSTGQQVRLGIVNVRPEEAPGRSVVAWLEVLSSSPDLSGPGGFPPPPIVDNNSLVVGEIKAVSSVSTGYWELEILVRSVGNVDNLPNPVSDKVGQVITCRTNEDANNLKVAQVITANVKLSGDVERETFLSASNIR